MTSLYREGFLHASAKGSRSCRTLRPHGRTQVTAARRAPLENSCLRFHSTSGKHLRMGAKATLNTVANERELQSKCDVDITLT